MEDFTMENRSRGSKKERKMRVARMRRQAGRKEGRKVNRRKERENMG